MDHEVVERARRAIYDAFASQGHAPSRQQIRDLAEADEAQVNEAVAELAAQRHLVLDQSGHVVMAQPFTTVSLGFSVMGERNLWWGGCAWDSFAIPNLVKDEPSVLVATTCPAWGPAGTAVASTAPTGARTPGVPPSTSVPLACTGTSGGSTTDVDASSVPAPLGLRHQRIAEHLAQREPFPPQGQCADLPAAHNEPAGQRDGIAQSP